MRTTIYELVGLLSAYEATCFFVGEYTSEHATTWPEFALADGIVELQRNEGITHAERGLRVHKMRGSGYLEGLHAIKITDAGVEVYPRLVTPPSPAAYQALDQRVETGVPGLDTLLGGGVWKGSTTLLVGPTGTGKTTIGLQFALAGVRDGAASLYLNLQENPTQTARQLESFGFAPGDAAARGLHLVYASPVELQIDSLIGQIFELITTRRLERVVIDSVGDLEHASRDPSRLHDYIYALIQHFAVAHAACLLTLGSAAAPLAEPTRYAYMCDNVIQLGLDRRRDPVRSLEIVKTRASAHDLGVHALVLDADGARVL
jgi:circadian clock protein KaiC